MTEEPIIAFAGNAALQKEVGQDFRIASHITEARIRAAENVMEEASLAFFDEAAPDLTALEALVTNLDAAALLDKEKVTVRVYNIRSFAKVLGLPLITDICIHLATVVESTELTEKKRVQLAGKLTEALRLAFNRRIRDDGGELGKALLQNLRSL